MANKTDKFVEIIRARGIEPTSVYDVGAFDGKQSLELAAAFPWAQVYAFEPVAANVVACLENTKHEPRITVAPVAVAERLGLCTFHQSTGPNAECGSLLEPNGLYPEPMPTRKIVVPCIRLMDWPITGLPQKLVLWVDVQGPECGVLEGLGSWKRPMVQAVWLEVAYRQYYHDQMLAGDLDKRVCAMGFWKVHEQSVNEWFGDACYVRI